MKNPGIGAQQDSKGAKNPGNSAESAKKIPCEHCSSLFTRQKDLNKHMKKYHQQEWKVLEEMKKQALLDAPYQCNVCH